jgi:ATP-dependent Lon protease
VDDKDSTKHDDTDHLPSDDDIDASLERLSEMKPSDLRAKIRAMLEEGITDCEAVLKPRDPAPVDLYEEKEQDETEIRLRGTMALMVLPGHHEPSHAMIEKFKAGVAMRWRVPSSMVWYVIVKMIFGASFRIYLVHPDLRGKLIADPNSDVARMTCELVWRLGEKGVLTMLKRNPWLSIKPPNGVPMHTSGGETKVAGVGIPQGLWSMILGRDGLGQLLDHALPDDSDDVATLGELLDGCVVPSESRGGVIVPQIPDALTHQLFSMTDVHGARQRLEGMQADTRQRLDGLYRRMIERGPERVLMPAPDPAALDEVMERFPNFRAEFFREQVGLAKLYGGALAFPPVLLVGPPGVGKTEFCHALAGALGLEDHHEVLPMSSTSASFVISGGSSAWTGSKPGRVAMRLLEGQIGNPLMILDEVDKAGGDPRYSPINSLLSLLERTTAKAFTDEHVEIKVDASRICFIATANDLGPIPEPILSRFITFSFDPLTVEQTRSVAASMYQGMMREPFGQFFEPELRPAVLDALQVMTPRELRLSITRALGRASLRPVATGELRHIAVDDLAMDNTPVRRPIGFCS